MECAKCKQKRVNKSSDDGFIGCRMCFASSVYMLWDDTVAVVKGLRRSGIESREIFIEFFLFSLLHPRKNFLVHLRLDFAVSFHDILTITPLFHLSFSTSRLRCISLNTRGDTKKISEEIPISINQARRVCLLLQNELPRAHTHMSSFISIVWLSLLLPCCAYIFDFYYIPKISTGRKMWASTRSEMRFINISH